MRQQSAVAYRCPRTGQLYLLTIAVDFKALGLHLARRAVVSKRNKATALQGAVIVWASKTGEPS